jgi:hypothetical protein
MLFRGRKRKERGENKSTSFNLTYTGHRGFHSAPQRDYSSRTNIEMGARPQARVSACEKREVNRSCLYFNW